MFRFRTNNILELAGPLNQKEKKTDEKDSVEKMRPVKKKLVYDELYTPASSPATSVEDIETKEMMENIFQEQEWQ